MKAAATYSPAYSFQFVAVAAEVVLGFSSKEPFSVSIFSVYIAQALI